MKTIFFNSIAILALSYRLLFELGRVDQRCVGNYINVLADRLIYC